MAPETTQPPTLETRRLAISYQTRRGDVPAVRDVSLRVEPCETYCLVGESGCGKSTVAFGVVNFLGRNGRIVAGQVLFQGQDLRQCSQAELNRIRGNKIAMVYQDPMQALTPTMRLGEQLSEVLMIHRGLSKREARARCIEIAQRVHLPDPEALMERYPHQISGGQQQRVVIAMALLNNPALLVMDEPTTALDVTVEAAVLDLVDELRRELQTSILFISHNLGVIARIADRVGVMYAGEIVESAPVEQIFAHPSHPYTRGLIQCLPKLGRSKESSVLTPIPGRVPPLGALPPGCTFEPRCPYARPACRQERPALRDTGPQQTVRCLYAEEIAGQPGHPTPSPLARAGEQAPDTQPSEALLSVDDARVYYRQEGKSVFSLLGLGQPEYVKAVDGPSFALAQGSTLGIVGESGCGKSSLIRAIVGLETLNGGKVEFAGADISASVAQRDLAVIRQLQMVFQNPDSVLNPSHTIGQQLARPLRRFKIVPDQQVYDEVIRLLEAVRLSQDYYDRMPQQLSGGEKQRIGIARAFAAQPQIVLCDEPVSALDVSVQAAILNLLLEIQAQRKTALILISHDISVVRYFSDRVAVMYLGQFVELGPVDAVFAPPFHPYTEALLSAVPVPDPTLHREQIRLEGRVPSALHPPSGCRFHTRCPRRSLLAPDSAICERQVPPWQMAGDGHQIACHIPLDILREAGATFTFENREP